ncbi:HAMP domain-containing sensor histidine kinase (plasmid) [Enterococcus faecalis]|uniref:sensor histidine kinase n=1 Tax=Enterococcus faecalis TaxID=1351 RepID=UPI00236208E8|nr:HAMP domain-containing sensor histidine kinase [Enterococcus faecalis]MDK4459551.1 HAMP domain-containing histidine kinase [Enterococcus faecalis]MDT2166538.1 HAMP domain-containing sensor histidine kinase [Enterococcus faecalis]WDA19762.1 HAMP domain-containing sensor histidine kinase [Enterococcus faecalis]
MYSWIIIIILITIVLIFLVYLRSLKTQIKSITAQLRAYNNHESKKKLDIALFNPELETLAEEMNKLMDTIQTVKASKFRTENELKSSISSMSHDLRTPLTSIIGYLQMAQAEEENLKEKREHLSIALKRAKTLESLLHSFFELSVIESADYKMNPERLNLKSLLVETLFGFYDRLHEKQIEPSVHIPDQDVWIVTDELAMTRILENLISNAMRHTKESITVELREKNSTVIFMIKNDAPSLTKHDINFLFDRFYMADQARTNHHAGLGLSIVKSLMEKMEGKITSHIEDGQLVISCEWQKVSLV